MNHEIKNELLKSNTKVQYDEKVKSFLANKETLSRILAGTVDDFKGKTLEEIAACIEDEPRIGKIPIDPGMTNSGNTKIRGSDTEDSEINEGLIRFDIIFYVGTPDGRSQIIINVEAQKDDPGQYSLLNRAIFYESRIIASQKARDFTGSNYDDIKKSYSIWLCMNQMRSSLEHFHLIRESIRGVKETKGSIDIFNVIIAGIPSHVTKEDTGTIFGYLGIIFSRTLDTETKIERLEKEYNVKMTEVQEGEMNNMCNLSEGIYEDGYDKGKMAGKAEGKALGKIEAARGMLRLHKLTLEEISQATGLAVEEIEKI